MPHLSDCPLCHKLGCASLSAGGAPSIINSHLISNKQLKYIGDFHFFKTSIENSRDRIELKADWYSSNTVTNEIKPSAQNLTLPLFCSDCEQIFSGLTIKNSKIKLDKGLSDALTDLKISVDNPSWETLLSDSNYFNDSLQPPVLKGSKEDLSALSSPEENSSDEFDYSRYYSKSLRRWYMFYSVQKLKLLGFQYKRKLVELEIFTAISEIVNSKELRNLEHAFKVLFEFTEKLSLDSINYSLNESISKNKENCLIYNSQISGIISGLENPIIIMNRLSEFYCIPSEYLVEKNKAINIKGMKSVNHNPLNKQSSINPFGFSPDKWVSKIPIASKEQAVSGSITDFNTYGALILYWVEELPSQKGLLQCSCVMGLLKYKYTLNSKKPQILISRIIEEVTRTSDYLTNNGTILPLISGGIRFKEKVDFYLTKAYPLSNKCINSVDSILAERAPWLPARNQTVKEYLGTKGNWTLYPEKVSITSDYLKLIKAIGGLPAESRKYPLSKSKKKKIKNKNN